MPINNIAVNKEYFSFIQLFQRKLADPTIANYVLICASANRYVSYEIEYWYGLFEMVNGNLHVRFLGVFCQIRTWVGVNN